MPHGELMCGEEMTVEVPVIAVLGAVYRGAFLCDGEPQYADYTLLFVASWHFL